MHSTQTIRHHNWVRIAPLLLLVAISGCAASHSGKRDDSATSRTQDRAASHIVAGKDAGDAFTLTAYRESETPEQVNGKSHGSVNTDADATRAGERPIDDLQPRSIEILPAPEPISLPAPIAITEVAASIHSTFPLLEAAYQENQIAAGNQTAAWGGFDTKLKASTENGPLGFYETYRNRAGFSRPIYQGGDVFGGYRVGRGDFQPWYLERQTNDGGEFKAGVSVPLLRNREIDARRAELWRATYDRRRVEPEIRAQLIMFVRDGSVAYWKWVAAGRQYEIGQRALKLAEQRNAQLKRKVDVGDVDPPVLQDNLRAIAKRESKLIDLRRKLQQAGVKLSLFLRSPDGMPFVPKASSLADFPQPSDVSLSQLDTDVAVALSERPELQSLDALASRINVDLVEARNDLLPTVDAHLVGSQDVGAPTSKKRDKSEFELEAGIVVEVPVQRRKARGKSQAAQGKLVQISAKRRFTEDKIRAEMQSSHAALMAAFERLDKARESKRLAEYMADVERRKFDLGDSDLLSVVLRERYAIEAAEAEVDALFEYFAAKADYDAAMARDWPTLEDTATLSRPRSTTNMWFPGGPP